MSFRYRMLSDLLQGTTRPNPDVSPSISLFPFEYFFSIHFPSLGASSGRSSMVGSPKRASIG